VVAQIVASGGIATAVKVDVTRPDEIEAMVGKVIALYGRLDCAVNSAGITVRSGPVADMSDDAWELCLSINLTGLARCMKVEIAAMLKTGGGSVVNISSAAGLQGVNDLVAYTASKHGVIGATKTAALDHALDNVRANVICPGLITTAMTQPLIDDGFIDPAKLCPMGRLGRPEEVGEAALWLCSDRSSFVSGVALLVDGANLAGTRTS
jgi:NAD(P)-dependent dehydrogenase (short-subunit alcohol dehydrogenase family)